jgi:hypothetical protein
MVINSLQQGKYVFNTVAMNIVVVAVDKEPMSLPPSLFRDNRFNLRYATVESGATFETSFVLSPADMSNRFNNVDVVVFPQDNADTRVFGDSIKMPFCQVCHSHGINRTRELREQE